MFGIFKGTVAAENHIYFQKTWKTPNAATKIAEAMEAERKEMLELNESWMEQGRYEFVPAHLYVPVVVGTLPA